MIEIPKKVVADLPVIDREVKSADLTNGEEIISFVFLFAEKKRENRRSHTHTIIH